MSTYRAAVIGLGRMGSTFDDEITQGGSLFLPYCHGPSYHAAPTSNWWPEQISTKNRHPSSESVGG